MNESVINFKADEIRDSFSDNIPTDVYLICKKNEIKLYEKSISAEGYLLCKNGKSSIVTKDDVSIQRKKFSIAHELGHFFLPEHSKFAFSCATEDMTFHTNKLIEKEANLFAAQLLMPKEILRRDINSDIDIEFISKEANQFEVSLSSMAIRLTQLAYDNMAIFWINDGIIKWVIKSKDFEYYPINRGRASQYSIADQLFEERKYQTIKDKVPAEAWLSEPSIDDVIEESIYFPSYNSVLTIIHSIDNNDY